MSNKLIYSVVKSISVLAAMTVASVGFTQDKYPSKPITFIMAVEAGADTFVAGSAVFKAHDPAAMVVSLRELAIGVAN